MMKDFEKKVLTPIGSKKLFVRIHCGIKISLDIVGRLRKNQIVQMVGESDQFVNKIF